MAATGSPYSVAGRPVGSIGYGLMGLTRAWAPIEYVEAAKVLKAALDRGANFWNAGMIYGTPEANSLQLLKYYFDKYPEDAEKVVLSLKGAYTAATQTPDCSPENIRASVEEALRVLDGVKKIDIFECSRVDPKVPFETSIRTLVELVNNGKIGGIGLSEVNAATIRHSHAIHPISVVEVELSLSTPAPLTNGIVATCKELGIPLVAYSPLGTGLLTGQFHKLEDFHKGDFRRFYPRFQADVLGENLKLVDAVGSIARRKGVANVQVAIAWVRSKGAIAIPSATTVERVVENSTEIDLSEEELKELDSIVSSFPVRGARYPEPMTVLLDL